jgi:N-sulfoglucosamine sulfohydrolase
MSQYNHKQQFKFGSVSNIAIVIFCAIAFTSLSFKKNKISCQKPPNILFLIADDAGIDFSAYGSSYVNTPAFDRIAKEGVLFNKAYTPNAKCAPSRSCILTGRNSWQLEAAANHSIYFPPQFKTFPEVLQSNGYEVGYTGKGYSPGHALTYDGRKRELLVKSYDTFRLQPPTKEMSRIDNAANFKYFQQVKDKNKPWFFWVGFNEPHRFYEYGTGASLGKKKTNSIKKVPGYFPDTDTVRNDLLDYAFEIEYMDKQVEKILEYLKETGELDNTIIVYTSDHGMPFPRVKGNQYEHSNHIPMAVMWNNGIKSTGRKIDDYVSFIDLAPTFLQAAGVTQQQSGMHPFAGKSLFNIFNSNKNGQVESSRNFVLVGQERHDLGRPNDVGYPIRGLHKNGMLYLINYEPNRWPACNPETGYLNTDGGATKTFILNQRRNGQEKKYWKLCFGHRVAVELYDIRKDPDCLINLAGKQQYNALETAMKTELETKLKAEGDYRMFGYGHIYEQYPSPVYKNFYEKYMNGEKLKTGWVNATDFEKLPIDDY